MDNEEDEEADMLLFDIERIYVKMEEQLEQERQFGAWVEGEKVCWKRAVAWVNLYRVLAGHFLAFLAPRVDHSPTATLSTTPSESFLPYDSERPSSAYLYFQRRTPFWARLIETIIDLDSERDEEWEVVSSDQALRPAATEIDEAWVQHLMT
ncbi:hypothetical protein JCM1840_002371 [Sporobolomyces johnsonii]